MVLWLPCMVLEVTLGGYDMLLTRGASSLVVVVVSSYDSNAPGVLLLSLPATLGTFPRVLDGGFGRWCSATTSGRFSCCLGQRRPRPPPHQRDVGW
jgi:hypothetical protein